MKHEKQLKAIYKQHPGYQKGYFKLLQQLETVLNHYPATEIFDRANVTKILKAYHYKGAEFDVLNDIKYYIDENELLAEIKDGIQQRSDNQQFDYVRNWALLGQNLQTEYTMWQRSGFKHLYYDKDYLGMVFNAPAAIHPLTNLQVRERLEQYNQYVIDDAKDDNDEYY